MRRRLQESFKYALKGLFYVIKTQKNMRIHLFIAVFVILAGIFLGLTAVKMAILCCVIIFVLITELVNTALEFGLDFVNNNKFNPSIKMVKDIAAAAVLVASINAVIVGCIIFLPSLVHPVRKEAPSADAEFEKIHEIVWEGLEAHSKLSNVVH